MMTINSVNYKAKIVKGDSGVITVSYGTRGFVTGDTVYLTVKKILDSDEEGNTVLEKEITEFNEDATCTITLEPSDTELLEVRWYYYDIAILDKDGRKDTLIKITDANFEVLLGSTNG